IRPTPASAGRTPSHEMTAGVTSAPTATAHAARPSMAPNTRASNSSGTRRGANENSPTSTSALPMPMTAISTTTAGSYGKRAHTTSGNPHNATPTPSSAARCRPVTMTATTSEPTTAPTPTAAFSTPTPASDVSNSSNAITTMNTLRQPRVNTWTIAIDDTTPASWYRSRARKPSAVSPTMSRSRYDGRRDGAS